MTKAAFIDSVETLYDMRRRVATNAGYIISDMLDEVGDMDYEYLYGDTDDPDWIYLDNDRVLMGLFKDNKNCWVHIAEYGNLGRIFKFKLYEMNDLDDIIEIADYLCRM